MSALAQTNTKGWRSSAAAVGLVLTAWSVLAAWGMSPYAEWLDHAEIAHVPAPAVLRLAVFTLGWTLMVVAMMLPATLLLLRRCVGDQTLSMRRLWPVILAYLGVWMVFGAISYWGDSVLHELVEQVPTLGPFVAPGVLLIAGVYQLTPAKRECLARCRFAEAVPPSLAHVPRAQRWAMGLRHGLFCLGSCWALMLVMFAAGGVNLVWMLTLTLLMTAERMSRQGNRLAQAAGVVMLLWSAAQAARL